ncbi:outer membrane protein assembly factor BamA [Candidatus Pelagibacter sp.]|uniref:outer membrane protein assembly factor BamA n=1 Tax=Candidatus Pelagibacter sp. TaxID=2024849 RepID=UPI003F879F54
MNLKLVILFISVIYFSFLNINSSFSQKIEKIEVIGNDRISKDVIIMFSEVSEGSDVSLNELNLILKKIYDSKFFENVDVKFLDNDLIIQVKELPIIESITIKGIKAKKIKEKAFENLLLKDRSSFNEIFLKKDVNKVKKALKDLGYYFSSVDVNLINLEDNKISLTYNVKLGDKAKIKKINFVGNKIYKDRKLKNIITSEESKFWKFISAKKFLNESLIKFDERLLKNFYLNEGYYDVDISYSFAKLIDKKNFELTYIINANEKFYFNDLVLNLPDDFRPDSFEKISNLFKKLKGENYSINKIEDILDEINKITLNEEFENIEATIDESIEKNLINLKFNIDKSEKLFVERINLFGNNITKENVIRNQLEIDEGEFYNKILETRSLNNIKNLGFFKDVSSEIQKGSDKNSKIINITVEEKPTGEIMAGAGVGTNGGSVMFSVKENNYLGSGVQVSNSVFLNSESIKGNLSITNPNYKNSDKLVSVNIEALETDRLKNFGYKTNKQGFSFRTDFEIYDDTRFGIGNSNFLEKISTNSNASARQKKMAGNYFDNFINLKLDYDKRDQKFQTTDGFRSRYFVDVPIISDTNTLSNSYTYDYFTQLFDNNRSNISFYIKSANSLTNKDIKLSERIFLPSNKLRGFERGKVGPKDGKDFIGGNYASSMNFTSTLPQLFENSQNVDVLFFMDAANIWGVDYDSSIKDNSKIRSSVGLGIDWLSPIGPMNFSFAQPITKSDTDITESFRFNLGTTF